MNALPRPAGSLLASPAHSLPCAGRAVAWHSSDIAPCSTRHTAGMPGDRLARLAARRAFVEMKASFMQAASTLTGPQAERLQAEIRRACEVTDLWRLHRALLAALPADGDLHSRHRQEIRQLVDGAFPDAALETLPSAL